MMAHRRQRLGRLGEDLAASHLEHRGYRIQARNVRYRGGELDLIVQNADSLVFVEVRARRGRTFGAPEESLTASKQQRLITLAETYLQEHASEELPANWRIDVVVVEFDTHGRLVRVEHIENAVSQW